ncbi:MAG: autotransporter-associated beta strand repeat-containing protein, partial [Planctomycetaceae bacterium]
MKTTCLRRLTVAALALLTPLAFAAREGRAANYTWTQFGNGSYNWSTAAYWNAGGAAVSSTTTVVLFGTSSASGTLPNAFTTTSTIDNSGNPFIVNKIGFNSLGSASTSGTLTIAGDAIDFRNNSTAAPVLDLNSGTSVSNGARPVSVINSNVVLNTGSAAASGTGLQLTVSSNNANLTINGTVSGTGGIYKTGAGVLFLTATNTFSGDININRGNTNSGGVYISGSGQLGATGTYAGNIIVTSSSGFTFGSSATQTLSGTISGGGSGSTLALQMVGSGMLRLTGNNTYTGTTSITGGTVQAGSAAAFGSSNQGTLLRASAAGTLLDVNGQAITAEPLTVTGSASGASVSLVNTTVSTSGTWGGAVTHATGVLGVGGAGNLTVGGALTGAGNVSKTGAGTVTLASAS